ncbi:Tetratricopeptide repeat protein 1 [Termitomyces sp. J132]|nr:Tetratricopeptide repeat protein 1 [Termitomyces sp. J132]
MDDATSIGRTIDIEVGSQEVITIDLDILDPNPEDVLDLLKDGQCKIWVWTKLAGEYWRKGYLEAAEKIARTAVESFRANGTESHLPPIYSMLANIQLAYARKAPKLILSDARQDDMKEEKSKEDHYREAAQLLNTGERVGAESGEGVGGTLSFLTRGIQQLATRSMDDALRSFDGVLLEKPTNVVALLGKARILYARRNFREALRIFQDVLRYNPQCLPDPRIGIGLCFWALDQKSKAVAAWQRSMEVNPSEWPAQLLLGLEAINSSKNDGTSETERASLFMHGTRLINMAFKSNQRSAAAANALCEVFLRKGEYNRALKLAERTIQFADTLTVLTEGYLRAGRVSHAEGSLSHASKYYSAAVQGQPKHVIGAIGLAQMQMQNDEVAAAIHTLDTLLQPPNAQRSAEATVMLASLRAHPRPGVSSSDVAQERAKARDLFDRVIKGFELEETRANGQSASKSPRLIVDDMEMHLEIARLWQGESMERMGKALREAFRINETTGQIDSRLLNNLAALQHIEGHFPEARALHEKALTIALGLTTDQGEAMSTTILYNLARVYEEQGEETLAKDAYEKLVTRHPEYVDAKIRQAQMLADLNRHNEAHELLKQCLVSQNNNLNLRAFYTYFLIQTNLPKPAKEFVFATLKDHDKHDVFSLCAAGWLQYHQARESRDASPKGIEERRQGFRRTAEFYEKALHLDPLCAFAAQGLAIVTAEDALGSLGGALSTTPGVDDIQKRLKNAREALDVFAKVRESIDDGSVYFNMGHCYYTRDEFDRAIESYETALMRYNDGHNVPTLLCLCRSWYAKAAKDQQFSAMKQALRYAQMAYHIQPNDKAIVYNIAMIQQKSAEMLFAISPAKRTLKDLQRRRKYGDSMLRKGDEHLAAQRQFESEAQAKIDAARRKRQEEKEKQEEVERLRMEELRKEAEKLAEERRLAREKAMQWTQEVKGESDEERERKPKKTRKPKQDAGSGDEAESKKKRRGKLKKAPDGDGEDQAMFTEDEEVERPAKKRRVKKAVVRDEEEEEEDTARPQTQKRQKEYKSKEMLSDTDDEMS